MRKYEYNGKIEEMKTLSSEVTIKEFNKISNNKSLYNGGYLYYLDILSTLGLSDEFIDDMDDITLYEIIKDFQEEFNLETTEFIKEVEIDGYKYSTYSGDNFKLNARDFAKIEERLVNDNENWISYAMAIIFKRTDLSKTEHNAPAHIKHKEKLFQQLTLDVALPYIEYISSSYIKNLKLLVNI